MRMKIVYLVHQFYPEAYTGTEKFVFNLSGMVQKAGNRVKVITYSFYDDSFYDQRRGDLLCKEFLYKGILVLAIKHKQPPDDLHYALENTALAEIADDLINVEKPDIVHVGHSMRMGALVQALKPQGVPYLLTLTDFFLGCPKVNLVPSRQPLCNGPEQGEACGRLCPEWQSDYIHQRLELARSMLFNARVVVAPSAFVAGVFMREFPGLAVKVVHHGLSFERLKRNQRTYANGDRIVFCYAGSFNPHKGTHVLVEAFKRLNPGNAVLKMYGSGPDESYVKSLRSMAATNDNIEFCGVYPESQTGEILSSVDVMVVPSVCYENYPMALHEALACNIPVIATKLGGMAETVRDGVNGFLFEMGDSRQLQRVLAAIVNDPPILNPLKRNISNMMIQGVEQEAYTYARAYRRLWDDRGSYRDAVANGSVSRSVPSPPRKVMASQAGAREVRGSRNAELTRSASVAIDVNHLELVPPEELIREHSGGIDRERFVSMGDEIVQHSLIGSARLLPSHRVLDVGCGCGKLARPLTRFLNSEGGYDGIDITREVINWCAERYQDYPNFRFHFADLHNDRYNPGGMFSASGYKFPFPNDAFDVVFVGSVFTHMVSEAIDNYIADIARVMKPGGVCLATYFLLDAVSRENVAAGVTSPKFAYEFESPTCRVDDLRVPEAAIAYDEGLLRDLYAKHGLTIERIVHGEWGRKGLVPHWQDEVWSRKVG